MKKYKAIDLFAGIGGIRLGYEQAFKENIEFVFSCEIDENCRKTYYANFREVPKIDIRDYPIRMIPDFDILLAGFPCQSFSLAGRKKGFNDNRGNLFFHIKRILEGKKPQAFLLENVKNLLHHDRGKTFFIIKSILEHELRYYLHYKILNASDFGLPQHRERIYIVGFKENLRFQFPEGSKEKVKIGDILEKKPVDEKYYLSQQYLNTLIKHKKRHQEKKNGFGYQIIHPHEIANTIVCGGMGLERNLIKDDIFYDSWKPGENLFEKKNNKGIRKLIENEWSRLQGFPKEFEFPGSSKQIYKQIANSVPIPVIKAIALKMKESLKINEILKSKRTVQININDYF